MKKIISSLMLFVFGAFLAVGLTGCGGSDKDKVGTPDKLKQVVEAKINKVYKKRGGEDPFKVTKITVVSVKTKGKQYRTYVADVGIKAVAKRKGSVLAIIFSKNVTDALRHSPNDKEIILKNVTIGTSLDKEGNDQSIVFIK